MKVGDLVRNLNTGELGVIVDFRRGEHFGAVHGEHPIVAWRDRTGFIMKGYVEVVSESR